MQVKLKAMMLCVCVLAIGMMMAGCGGGKYETTISLESGEYLGEQEVTLTSTGGTIYYTLDGSDPTQDSFVYNADSPLIISYDATLKARAIEGGSKGKIAQADYKIKEKTTQKLTDVERVFVGNIRGSYELNGNTIFIDSGSRTIEWNIDGDQGSSEFMVSCPEDGDGESGKITYTGTDGKEKSFNVKTEPSGDNAVYFNDDNYNYLG